LVELKPKIELKIAGYCSKNKTFRLLYIRIHIWTKNRIALDHVYIERRHHLKIDPGSPGTDLKINDHWTKNRMAFWTNNGLKIAGRWRPFRLKITMHIDCV